MRRYAIAPVMDGYSVKEAATVLGVPKRRVWELIARGVLSGAPEGDGGMRVFLQPRPGKPSPLSADREEPRRSNGNGGHVESGEGSPFREILTEFRSLTERYGQALLALGEARGEVAALRSRVELLEARLDLRLPGPRTSSTVAWEMPEYSPPPPPMPEVPDGSEFAEASVADAPAADAPAADASTAAAETEATAEAIGPSPFDEPPSPISAPDEAPPDRGSSRRRRVLRSHSAIAGIAEALERAQDPTLADLPGAREAAEALAALQREVEARTETIEPTPVVEEPPMRPDVEAAMTAAPEPEPEPEPEPTVAAAEVAFVEPAAATSAQELVVEEPRVEEHAAEEPRVEEQVVEERAVEERAAEEPSPAVFAEDAAETGLEPEPVEGVGEPEPASARPEATATSPYTTEIVEPDWFADGDFTWLETAEADSVSVEGVSFEAAGAAETPLASDASPVAEAIRDDLEPPESHAATDESEPDLAVHAEASEPESAAVADLPQAEPQPQPAWELAGDREQDATEAEAVPAAEAIQDAFEPMETEAATEASEPAFAVDAELAEPEPVVAANLPQAEPEPEQAWEPVEELVPADAIQDAFDDVYETAVMPEAELEVPAEPEVPAAEKIASEPVASAAVADAGQEQEAELEPPPGWEAALGEPVVEAAATEDQGEEVDADAGPAAGAIQDAFEPTEPVAPPPSVAAGPAATATPHEEPFSPADVAAYTVDHKPEQSPSQAEPAPIPDADAQPPPDVRAELPSMAPPPPHPRPEGLGGLAVQAAALPAVQPIAPVTARPDEEELMWLGDEFEAAGLEIAAPGWHSEPQASEQAQPTAEAEPAPEPQPIPESQPAPESSVQPAVEPAGPDAHAVPHEAHAHGMSDADLEQIAQDEGWDEDEVDAIRTLLGRPTAAFSVDAPLPPDDVHPMDEGRTERAGPETLFEPDAYQEPEAQLEPEPISPVEWPTTEPIPEATVEATAPEPITGVAAPEPLAPRESPEQQEPADTPPAVAEPTRAIPIEESIRRSIAARPGDRPSGTTDPDWLRRRRGPAARAYRRLRRLLPG